jgi:NADPH:quinone reductase-like Zn-dependent oxidoreductase
VVNYGDGLEARLRSAVAQIAPGQTAPDAFLDFNGNDYVRLAVALGVDKRRIDTIADFAAAAEYGVRTDGNAEGSKPEIMVDLARLAAEDKLEIPISGTYPLDRVRDAYTELEQGHTFGKIVLLP